MINNNDDFNIMFCGLVYLYTYIPYKPCLSSTNCKPNEARSLRDKQKTTFFAVLIDVSQFVHVN